MVRGICLWLKLKSYKVLLFHAEHLQGSPNGCSPATDPGRKSGQLNYTFSFLVSRCPNFFCSKSSCSFSEREHNFFSDFFCSSRFISTASAGRVVRGEKRGRELGYPTANIACGDQLLPPDGVYAGRARAGDRATGALLNIGGRPTFSGDERPSPVVEVHLLDFQHSIYRRALEFEFVGRLRPERKFSGPGALARQIKKDEAAARIMLRGRPMR